ncbi:MAG TPA: hypothetical protein VMG11_04770 [Steroidobacteraceae bacterium]|nr:hypothetical protein [Steroidobacteraceae bacterium]
MYERVVHRLEQAATSAAIDPRLQAFAQVQLLMERQQLPMAGALSSRTPG